MDCKEFTSLLDQIGEGEMSREDRARLEKHAASCAQCRMALDLRELYAADEVSADASARWRAALAHEEARKTMSPARKTAAWTRYLAAAAAVMFVFVGALTVRQNNPGAKSISSPTATQSPMLTSTDDASEALYDNDASVMRMAAGAPNGVNTAYLEEAPLADGEKAEKIIKSASLTVKTNAFDDDLALLKSLALAQGGRVESERISGDQASGTLRSASVTLRVPAQVLDDYLTGVKGISGRVTSSNQSVEDVSDSYYDTEGRLNAQKTKMSRLLELIEKAENVSDLIELESAVSDTQYLIDSYQGKLKGYDDRVSYSTVSLTVKEERVRDTAEDTALTFGQRVQKGLSDSFAAVWEFLSDAGVFLVIAAPWLLIACIVIGGIILLRKHTGRRDTRGEEKKDD